MSIGPDFLAACGRLQPVDRFVVAEDATRELSEFVWIRSQGASFLLEGAASRPLELPVTVVHQIMERYAFPLGEIGDVTSVIALDDGSLLAHMLFVPDFDVEPKDYLVWQPKAAEPLVELCTRLVPPLIHLARVLAAREGAPPGRDGCRGTEPP